MIRLFNFIDWIALGIYLIVAGLILWRGRRLWLTFRQHRAAYYEFERDLARREQNRELTNVILIIQFVVIILGIQLAIMPFFENEQLLQAQVQANTLVDDGEFITSTPAPPAGGFDIQPVPPLGGDNQTILLLTPTLTPTPVGTIIPNAPAIEGCNDPRATLQIPANGMRVFNPIAVVGTAYDSAFTSAKIEIRGPSTNNAYWVVGETFQEVRDNSAFSQFTPIGYAEGLYQLRLMVFNLSGTPVAACMVNIYISAPPAAATPTPRVR